MGPARAPSARAMVRPVGVAGRGECRAFLTPGPCCASLMRAAVLPLLERAARKGPREAGGRNGLWCAPSARGCGARCRRDGRGESVRGAARREGPLQNRRTQGSERGFWRGLLRRAPPCGGEKREKERGLPQAFAAADPFFQSVPVCFGDALCAGCSTALPWPVRPARRRRTPPARAPARPRPGPWPHTALPFRSS